MNEDSQKCYSEHYVSHNPEFVYPTEFVIRTLLGNYPRLALDKTRYRGAKLLDMGFGDCRNFPLFHNIGFQIHGVEISDKICELGRERINRLGIEAELKTGTNAAIPYPNAHFDYLVACYSCYYVDSKKRFSDTVSEYARVLKPSGVLIASVPQASCFIFDGAEDSPDGHIIIKNDPFGIRNGIVLRRFNSTDELESELSPAFGEFSFGSNTDDFYGLAVDSFLVVCKRTA